MLKSADSFAYVGDFVEYQIKVYNPSDYGLYNINVTDPMLGLIIPAFLLSFFLELIQ